MKSYELSKDFKRTQNLIFVCEEMTLFMNKIDICKGFL